MVQPQSKGHAEPQAGAATGAASDDDLVDRVVAGQREAYEALVARYQDRVFTLLLRQTGSREDAEDLAQETFLKAYRALGSFRKGAQFYTWLFRIAVNAAFSRGRQTARRAAREGVSLDGGHTEADEAGALGRQLEQTSAPAPEVEVEREEVRRRVREGLAQIKEEYRAILLLREMEGMDYDAIGDALELSRAAVKSRLHRARLELARVLKDLAPDGASGTDETEA